MASLGSLVAGIAHELNTPIGNSLLASTSLRDRVELVHADYRELDRVLDALNGANGAAAALVYVPHTTAGITIQELIDEYYAFVSENLYSVKFFLSLILREEQHPDEHGHLDQRIAHRHVERAEHVARLFPKLPRQVREDTPALVQRLKLHPAMLTALGKDSLSLTQADFDGRPRPPWLARRQRSARSDAASTRKLAACSPGAS